MLTIVLTERFFQAPNTQPERQEAPCSSLKCPAKVIGLNSLSPPLRRTLWFHWMKKASFLS